MLQGQLSREKVHLESKYISSLCFNNMCPGFVGRKINEKIQDSVGVLGIPGSSCLSEVLCGIMVKDTGLGIRDWGSNACSNS